MSLNKFTDAEKSLPLGLEAGFKKLIVDELVETGVLSSSLYRSTGDLTLQNNVNPESVAPAGVGALSLSDVKAGDAYEMTFQGVHEVGFGAQVEFALFALPVGVGVSTLLGSLLQTWATGTSVTSFKVSVKFVAFLDGAVESVRSYFTLVSEDGGVTYKGEVSAPVALPFDQLKDIDLTMQVTNVSGTTQFVFQCGELLRTR